MPIKKASSSSRRTRKLPRSSSSFKLGDRVTYTRNTYVVSQGRRYCHSLPCDANSNIAAPAPATARAASRTIAAASQILSVSPPETAAVSCTLTTRSAGTAPSAAANMTPASAGPSAEGTAERGKQAAKVKNSQVSQTSAYSDRKHINP